MCYDSIWCSFVAIIAEVASNPAPNMKNAPGKFTGLLMLVNHAKDEVAMSGPMIAANPVIPPEAPCM